MTRHDQTRPCAVLKVLEDCWMLLEKLLYFNSEYLLGEFLNRHVHAYAQTAVCSSGVA